MHSHKKQLKQRNPHSVTTKAKSKSRPKSRTVTKTNRRTVTTGSKTKPYEINVQPSTFLTSTIQPFTPLTTGIKHFSTTNVPINTRRSLTKRSFHSNTHSILPLSSTRKSFSTHTHNLLPKPLPTSTQNHYTTPPYQLNISSLAFSTTNQSPTTSKEGRGGGGGGDGLNPLGDNKETQAPALPSMPLDSNLQSEQQTADNTTSPQKSAKWYQSNKLYQMYKQYGKRAVISLAGVYFGGFVAFTTLPLLIPGYEPKLALDWLEMEGYIPNILKETFHTITTTYPMVGEPIKKNPQFFSKLLAGYLMNELATIPRLALAFAITRNWAHRDEQRKLATLTAAGKQDEDGEKQVKM